MITPASFFEIVKEYRTKKINLEKAVEKAISMLEKDHFKEYEERIEEIITVIRSEAKKWVSEATRNFYKEYDEKIDIGIVISDRTSSPSKISLRTVASKYLMLYHDGGESKIDIDILEKLTKFITYHELGHAYEIKLSGSTSERTADTTAAQLMEKYEPGDVTNNLLKDMKKYTDEIFSMSKEIKEIFPHVKKEIEKISFHKQAYLYLNYISFVCGWSQENRRIYSM